MNNSGYHPIKDNPHIPTHGSNIRRNNSMNEQKVYYKVGWLCPICGRVLSPDTSVCPCYHDFYKVNRIVGVPQSDTTDETKSQSKTNFEISEERFNLGEKVK